MFRRRPPAPRITVGSALLHYSTQVLTPGEDPDLDLLVSIGDPGEAVPPWTVPYASKLLRLEFSDVEEDGFPLRAMSSVQFCALTTAARTLPGDRSARIHVHCTAGRSRSAAVALALYVTLCPRREQEAIQRLLAQRPQACPNLLILRLTDQHLGSRLERTWLAHQKRHSSVVPETHRDKP